jgi:two-component system, NtrC family, sensor kinase
MRKASRPPGKSVLPKARKEPIAGLSTAHAQEKLDRALRERDEALQQQTATADVLKVISRSTFDLQPVLNTLTESAARLCEAYDSVIFLRQNERLQVKAHYGPIPVDISGWPIERSWVTGRAFLDRAPVYIHDAQASTHDFPDGTQMALRVGHRTILAVPLLREDEAIGALTIRRTEVKPFTDKQIELVRTFADQAVIAIENVRLFDEVQARTRELSESLEQQTATSEVLKVISSFPGELQPVFETMLENAVRICDAKFGNLWTLEGRDFRIWAMHGAPPAYAEARRREPVIHFSPGDPLGRIFATKQVQHITDLRMEQAYIEREAGPVILAEKAGARTVLLVPMLKEDELIGVIAIYRQEVRPFTEKQIDLVKNFAAQAVIAIENARLLNEQRESLERQTATSEVLQVISSSPGELEPVFNALLANATRICEATFGNLILRDGPIFRFVAVHGKQTYTDFTLSNPVVDLRDNPGIPFDRLAKTNQVVHIPVLRTDQSYIEKNARIIKLADVAGARTLLNVPMLKERELIGVIALYREEVRPFTDKQVELVTNFAAQAVIAIENTRLLNELRQRTDDLSESLEQQTATSEVLKVISSSPGKLEPVFQAMLENAVRICSAKFGNLYLSEGDALRAVAFHGAPPAYVEERRRNPVIHPNPATTLGRAMTTKQPVQIADIQGYAPDNIDADSGTTGLKFVKLAGARTVLAVPMVKESELVGAIIIYRQEVLPFTDKQIELVQNFGAQAVIAVENTRLLNELRQRTDDLSESLCSRPRPRRC